MVEVLVPDSDAGSRHGKPWDAMGIEGNRAHRGPSTTEPRCVIFAATGPKDNTDLGLKHNPKEQINAAQAVFWFNNVNPVTAAYGDIAMMRYTKYTPWHHYRNYWKKDNLPQALVSLWRNYFHDKIPSEDMQELVDWIEINRQAECSGAAGSTEGKKSQKGTKREKKDS